MNFSLRFGDPSIFVSGDQDTALEVLTESFSKDVSLIPVDPADLDSLTTEPVYYLNSSAGVTSISTVNPTVPTLMELMRRFIGTRCKTIGGLLILPQGEIRKGSFANPTTAMALPHPDSGQPEVVSNVLWNGRVSLQNSKLKGFPASAKQLTTDDINGYFEKLDIHIQFSSEFDSSNKFVKVHFPLSRNDVVRNALSHDPNYSSRQGTEQSTEVSAESPEFSIQISDGSTVLNASTSAEIRSAIHILTADAYKEGRRFAFDVTNGIPSSQRRIRISFSPELDSWNLITEADPQNQESSFSTRDNEEVFAFVSNWALEL